MFGFWDRAESRWGCGVIGTNLEEEELSGEEIGEEEEMTPKLREGNFRDSGAYSYEEMYLMELLTVKS